MIVNQKIKKDSDELINDEYVSEFDRLSSNKSTLLNSKKHLNFSIDMYQLRPTSVND